MQPGDTPIDPGMAGSGSGGADTAPPPPQTVTANCTPPEGDVPELALSVVAEGLDDPLYVTGVPGDDTRLFVLEKPGRVRVLVDGVLQETPFLDLTNQIVNGNETGLLGIAFHPAYATNGLFYVHYSSNGSQGLPPNGDTVIAEFQVDASNRSLANAASRRIVLQIDQPQANHNGGEITFGPDGMLYFGSGDGGGGGDTPQGDQAQAARPATGNGQSLNTLLGKLVRIDPLGRDVNGAYSVPADNLAQVTGQQALPEIWAYGLRNPWRFSFDACNGDLYIGDVGQNALEEIDYIAASDSRTIPAGLNFGWRLMEGPNCFNPATNCPQAGLTLPVASYARGVGRSVTGGYVYRGSSIPGLRGTYLYADHVTARFFSFRIQDGAAADAREITDQLQPSGGEDSGIASFGTDNAGELYVTAFDPGAVYRIVAAQ
jgi:glucose/arabinose dehydrogenase